MEKAMKTYLKFPIPDVRKSPARHIDPQVEIFQSSKGFSHPEDRPPAIDFKINYMSGFFEISGTEIPFGLVMAESNGMQEQNVGQN